MEMSFSLRVGHAGAPSEVSYCDKRRREGEIRDRPAGGRSAPHEVESWSMIERPQVPPHRVDRFERFRGPAEDSEAGATDWG